MKHLKSIIKSASFISIFVFISACQTGISGSGKINLKLKLNKGDIYQNDIEMVMIMSESLMGKSMNINTTMGMGHLMEVKDIDANGNYNLKMTYDHMKLKMNSASLPGIEFDTNDSTINSKMNELNLNGLSFNIKLSTLGEILEITGMKELFNKMEKDIVKKSKKDKMEFKDIISEDNFKQSFGTSFNVFPEHGINIGDY